MLATDTVRAELRKQYEEALAEIPILQVESRTAGELALIGIRDRLADLRVLDNYISECLGRSDKTTMSSMPCSSKRTRLSPGGRSCRSVGTNWLSIWILLPR